MSVVDLTFSFRSGQRVPAWGTFLRKGNTMAMNTKTLALILALALASAAALAVEVAPQPQSAAMAKCREGGEYARQNPTPCSGNDMGCAMAVKQREDMTLEACKQAMAEMMPPPLPVPATPVK